MTEREVAISSERAETSRYSVRVLERAIRLLEVMADGKPWRLSDLGQAVALSSSTTYRILATLSDHGYIQRHKRDGGYTLGPACLELAHSYFKSNDMRRLALPDLEALRDQTTETVHLGILDEWEVVYLEKLQGLHAIGIMASTVGGRLPAYCTGLGKALLAYGDVAETRRYFEKTGLQAFTQHTIRDVDELMAQLGETRSRGFALDRGEHEAEVRCIAATILDTDGKAVAAVSVSAPAGRLDLEADNDEIIEAVKQSAVSISVRIAYLIRG